MNEKVPTAVITTEKTNQLAYCHVPKAASSLWMLAFADMNYLNKNETQRLHKKLALHGMLMTNFSTQITSQNEIEELNNSNLYKFVFIRHPFERLVSAYHDKFVHTKQIGMMLPFLKREIIKYMFKEITKKQKSSPTITNLPLGIDLSFNNFIEFVLEEANYSHISLQSNHWWPFSDVCKLCKIQYDYIGHLESLSEDVKCILKNFPNFNLLNNMKDRVETKINAGGNHNGDMTLKYFSQLAKGTIRNLYDLYKADFLLGSYDYPQNYIDVGKD